MQIRKSGKAFFFTDHAHCGAEYYRASLPKNLLRLAGRTKKTHAFGAKHGKKPVICAVLHRAA
jgi:hypothetical protein